MPESEKAAMEKEFEHLKEAFESLESARKIEPGVIESASLTEEVEAVGKAFDKGDYQIAAKKAKDIQTQLGKQDQATRVMASAEAAIKAAGDFGCAVGEAEDLLQQAAAAREAGNIDDVIQYANRAKTRAEEIKSAATPSIEIAFSQTEFRLNERKSVDVSISNLGTAIAYGINLIFEEDEDIQFKVLTQEIQSLAPGEFCTVRANLKPVGLGDIPIIAQITCKDADEMSHDGQCNIELSVAEAARKGGKEKDEDEGKDEKPDPTGGKFPKELNFYEPKGFLAEGGFASVFEVKNPKGNTRALKVPRDRGKEIVEYFKKEMGNWSRLDHGNIVRLEHFGTQPIPYLEMEFCKQDLARLGKPLPPTEAALMIFDVARGLANAHQNEVLHLDIKPANILIKDGVPKLGDWGLSRVKAHSTLSDHRTDAGTPLYSAPEIQSMSKFGKWDERTDIFELGIVFYELLCGTNPFFREKRDAICSAIQYDDPLPLTGLKTGDKRIASLEPIVFKCLEKEQVNRYQSVNDFREELAKVLREQFRLNVELSFHQKRWQEAALDCVTSVVIQGETSDQTGMQEQLADIKEYARKGFGNEVGESMALCMEAVINILMKCPQVPGHDIAYKEVKPHLAELRGFLEAVEMAGVIDEDQELMSRIGKYDQDPKQVLKWQGQGDMRFICRRLATRFQTWFLRSGD